ncbi:PTS system N-acetylgalactosamine-specific transporter subunit IIB [Escherichia coli]|uniref:PTS system N-acetylgalactosamine-specific transporter subunit IIB n=1 Tax=Escherichia coli TaxID=562 RepID=A0A376MK85_ECOLX|nr:PTS system N-acetylgalactosamine-specific transporter subunit IIB [Escherichia coli]VED08115.1 PTS system N-acetylgalactosamine-specific transporter subunit IIB [Escherichia coli]
MIHGQVGVQWVGFAGANLVLVANDEVAEDPVQQNLMEMVLAEGIAVRFWTLQKSHRQHSSRRRSTENPAGL